MLKPIYFVNWCSANDGSHIKKNIKSFTLYRDAQAFYDGLQNNFKIISKYLDEKTPITIKKSTIKHPDRVLK